MSDAAKLDSLPGFERSLLEVISAAFFPANRTTLSRVLRHGQYVNGSGHTATTQDIAKALQRLQAEGWVDGDESGYGCKAELCDAVALAAAKRGTLDRVVRAVRCEWKPPRMGEWWWKELDLIRNFRLEVLVGSPSSIETTGRQLLEFTRHRIGPEHPLAMLFSYPAYDLLSRMPPALQKEVLDVVLSESTSRFARRDLAFESLLRLSASSEQARLDLTPMVLEQLTLRGRIDEVEAILGRSGEAEHPSARAWLAFLRGRHSDAVALYRSAMSAARKRSRAKKLCLPDLGAVFYPIVLRREGTEKATAEAEAFTAAVDKLSPEHPNSTALWRVRWMQEAQSGAFPDGATEFQQTLAEHERHRSGDYWAAFIGELCATWLGVSPTNADVDRRVRLFNAASDAGLNLVAAELAALLAKYRSAVPPSRLQEALSLFDRLGLRPASETIAAKASWQAALEGLSSLAPVGPSDSATAAAQVRLAWILEPWSAGYQVEPVEQKRNANGKWTKGRPVALRRLAETPDEFPYLTPADRAVCSAIQAHTYRNFGYTKVDYYIEPTLALPLLRDHPAVFVGNDRETPIEISVAPPALCAHTTATGIRLTLSPQPGAAAVHVVRDGPTRLRVIRVEDIHRRMANLIGTGLDVPADGMEQVSRTLSALVGLVAIEADVDVSAAGLRQVEADSRPHVQLIPSGVGFRVRTVVGPLGSEGPSFAPGAGPATLIGERDGERVCVVRERDAERRRVSEVVAACPSLEGVEHAGNEWLIAEPDAALSLLLELADLGELVVVEWPKGQSVRPPTRVGLRQLRLSLRSADEWFALEGELRVDEELVLGVRQLVEAIEAQPGRFIPIGEGRLLALSEELQQRIRTLSALGTAHQDAIRLHPLAAVVAPELGEGTAGLKADKAWKARARLVSEAMSLEPEVPSTLQAELRPYQMDGFRWLVRLAHAGVGACLADDMGLGKTLEALAAALTLAHKGPTLVVAPTSVCFNWMEEAARFAPTLRPVAFGPGDRKAMLSGLAPLDVVVCSYGLLFQESEALRRVHWAMVVLDEAQAIKNPDAKRSAAAMSLDAGFRLAMTGTPIENRLDDLWSLFRVINPGLLGAQDTFRERFANPIERQGRKDVAARLKTIVQPFLLRRTKAQVLSDLPALTEVTRKVELNDVERATYEALRRATVEQLAGLSGDQGQAHIIVLSALTKLRRACCHARLAMPTAPLVSSKLEALGEILDDLRANRHKALVFSQFVGHLELVREYVASRGVRLQYLDGSTPPQERKRSVEAFQNGEGDVFLISLKAGGFGLNLTAADYVVHMDPWWNPAVEDQASDRAHRIGQSRPVTVYRLVAANTIEEKILRLHSQKRELADRLLEGSDQAVRVSLAEMLSLLRETG